MEQAWGVGAGSSVGTLRNDMSSRHQGDVVGRQLDGESLPADMLGSSQNVDSTGSHEVG